VSEPIRATVAVDALLDELAIVHLDFHPTCGARVRYESVIPLLLIPIPWGRAKSCAQPAVGAVTCRWCGTSMSVCAPHRDLAADPSTACVGCGFECAFRFTPWGA
jgi:hypothetical protein